MIDWYKKVVFENYANFNGRARRSEYWFYCLASIIISIVLAIVDYYSSLAHFNGQLGIFRGLYSLLVFIPGLAVSVRRMHDIGKSGWILFIALIPVIGLIWLFILFCTEGEYGTNQYGKDPNDIFDDIDEIGRE